MDDLKFLFAALSALLTFIIGYIYCIVTYGFLFGVGLGWLPSAIVACAAFAVVYLLWRFIGVVALVGAFCILYLIK